MPRNSFSVRATGAVTAPLAQLTVDSAGLELMVRRLFGSNKTTTIPAAAISSVGPIVEGAWTAVDYLDPSGQLQTLNLRAVARGPGVYRVSAELHQALVALAPGPTG